MFTPFCIVQNLHSLPAELAPDGFDSSGGAACVFRCGVRSAELGVLLPKLRLQVDAFFLGLSCDFTIGSFPIRVEREGGGRTLFFI